LAVDLNFAQAALLKTTFLIRTSKPEDSDEVHQQVEKLLQQAADLGSPLANDLLQKYKNSKNQAPNDVSARFSEILGKDLDFKGKFDEMKSDDGRKSDFGLPPLDNYLPERYNNKNNNSNDLIPKLNF
jgi:hypothetical protein